MSSFEGKHSSSIWSIGRNNCSTHRRRWSFPPTERGDAIASEEAAIAPKLELLRNYRVVERLDLLEDFDILRNLDSPTGRRES